MFFSLKWKAIVLVLVILVTLTGFLVFLNSYQLQNLAHQQQQQNFEKINKEITGLLIQSYHYNLQMMDVIPLLRTESYTTENYMAVMLEENWPILQLNWNIENAALYDSEGKLMWFTHTPSQEQAQPAATIAPTVGPNWYIDCNTSCLQVVSSPILDRDGDTYHLILDILMADMLIDFSRIANTNFGIITPAQNDGREYAGHIKRWDYNIKQITNPSLSLDIINDLQNQYKLEDAFNKNIQLHHKERTYDVSLTALEKSNDGDFFIIIKDSSDSTELMNTARGFQVIVALSGITLSCALILSFLWQPIQRLHRQAELLPKLTTGEFSEALEQLKKNRSKHWLKDEIDTLNTTEEEVCLQLTAMQAEISEQTNHLHSMAMYDSLTDLANRRSFMQYINDALKRPNLSDNPFSLLFIDLDNFKRINDSMGHNAGDELLKIVAKRLRACVRNTDVIARLGGDEFCIILNDSHSKDGPKIVAEHILQSLHDPIKLGKAEPIISASIGLVTAPADGNTSEELLQNADLAMYRAKALGRNKYQEFDQHMTANAIENMALENDLRKAIKEQEFELYYQPQIDFSQNCIIGFEALIRWRHPSKGLLFPDTFIGLLEETGLIVPLGHWIIDNACQTLRQWLDTGAKPVRLAINLSPRQLHNEELSDQISRSLHLHNLPAELLELEITESMLMQDIQFTHKQLRSLQQLGITIAIDDFGTGHSSLSYLKELPLDILKIDRSFIRDIIEDNNDQQIVNAIIAMAHQLNLKVVAEGIETIAHQSMLIQQGCDYGQGYLYSRPVPADSALELIKFDTDKAMDSMALN